jgi:hypothetical protein
MSGPDRRRDHEKRPLKITFGEMRDIGVCGLLIYLLRRLQLPALA